MVFPNRGTRIDKQKYDHTNPRSGLAELMQHNKTETDKETVWAKVRIHAPVPSRYCTAR